jgi:hypothetical protein
MFQVWVIYGVFVVALVGPSLVEFRRRRQFAPRVDSFLAKAQSLIRTQLIVLAVVSVIQALLILFMVSRPEHVESSSYDPSFEQYAPKFSAWYHTAVRVSALSALVTGGAMFVVAVIFLMEIAQTQRWSHAKKRIAQEGEIASHAEVSAPLLFDFGSGDEQWIFYGPVTEGYRETRPILGRARGNPEAARTLMGPVLSAFALVVLFVAATADVILSMMRD